MLLFQKFSKPESEEMNVMRSHRYILSLLSNAVKESHEDSETYSSHGVYICTGWVFPSSADSGISVSDPRSHTHEGKGREED